MTKGHFQDHPKNWRLPTTIHFFMDPSSNSYRSFSWGVTWMLLSATFLSVSFLFLKINLTYINYFLLLFLRFLIPLLFVVITLTISWNWKQMLSLAYLPLQLSRCLCVLVAQYAIAFYIAKSNILNATVLLNASPLFIPFIEWGFLGHRPGKSTIISALLSFIGVILILQPGRSLFSLLSGVGLLAALGQAGSQVLYGLKSKNEHPLTSLFYLFFFATFVSGIIFLFADGEKIIKSFPKEWEDPKLIISITVLMMALGTLFNQFFRGLAYRSSRPSTLATFLYFSVFVSAFFDWIVYKKTPTILVIIGSLLIIAGGILKIFLRAKILKKRNK